MKKIGIGFLRLLLLGSLCAALYTGWHMLEDRQITGKGEIIFVGTQNDADACLFFGGSRCVLVDTGEAQDAAHILEILQEKQIDRIDCLILTHPDQDHVGGASAIMDAVEIAQVIAPYFSGEKETYNDFMNRLQQENVPVLTLSRERQFVFGDFDFLLFPPAEFQYNQANEYSLAILAEHQDVSLFLAGDAEGKRMKELLELPLPKHPALYKVANHGRDESAGAELIKRLQPLRAVVTADRAEEEIGAALESAGTEVFYSRGQDLYFVSDGSSLRLERTVPF